MLRDVSFCPHHIDEDIIFAFFDTIPWLRKVDRLAIVIAEGIESDLDWVAVPPPSPFSPPPVAPLLPLQHLEILIFKGGIAFTKHLLSLLQPSSLRSCVACIDPTELSFLDRLFHSHQNLTSLNLLTIKLNEEIGPYLEHLLRLAGEVVDRSLELSIGAFPLMNDTTPSFRPELSSGGKTVNDFLALVPPSVSTLELNYLHFVDAKIPPPTEEARGWGVNGLTERMSTLVKVGVVPKDEDDDEGLVEVTQRQFVGLRAREGLVWAPLSVGR
jgi:hypothetical protein